MTCPAVYRLWYCRFLAALTLDLQLGYDRNDKAVKRDMFLIGRKGHAIDVDDIDRLFLKAEKQFEEDAEPDRSYACPMLRCYLNEKVIAIDWSS